MLEIGEGPENRKRMRESKETVQAKCKKRQQQLPNMRCSPERLCEVVSVFSEEQRRWVNQMGFGHLIKLSLKKVDRYLGLWLMKKFDPEKKCLLVRDDCSVVVDPNDVGWVMGIPGLNTPVPTDICKEELRLLKLKYGNNIGIDERLVFEALVFGGLPETEFKQTFLLYSLGVLLCPTQCCKISPKHLKVLPSAQNAKEYNWCQYVFNWLISCARRFRHSKSQAGGYGGCAIFLMIFYLDRINIGNPVNWSLTSSRVDAWDHKMYLYVIKKDEKNSEEFGNAEFLPNVMYGEHYPIGSVRSRWEDTRSSEDVAETPLCLLV